MLGLHLHRKENQRGSERSRGYLSLVDILRVIMQDHWCSMLALGLRIFFHVNLPVHNRQNALDRSDEFVYAHLRKSSVLCSPPMDFDTVCREWRGIDTLVPLFTREKGIGELAQVE